jgi:release factor glutamine methyltransferase
MTARGREKAQQQGAEVWTTRRLIAWMIEHFAGRGVDAPRHVAELLLAHVLDCERLRLYMEVDRPASPAELDRLRNLVRRASNHEPVQYLVGRAAFFGHEFLIDRSTQIPQPCTEDLVSAVIDFCREQASARGDSAVHGLRIADIGTGSGCIAISLALHLPDARVVATDISAEALDLARRNAERFAVADRIELRNGSLFDPILVDATAFDVICSNPPYIPDAEWSGEEVQRGVREFTPDRAVRGGPDGLDLIRPLIAGAGTLLRPAGLLAIEIADCQREAVIDLVSAAQDLIEPRVSRDGDGLWRLLTARRATMES